MAFFPAERLYEEIAFLAYYTHWPREELMNMEHAERMRWCKEVSEINGKLNGEEERKNVFGV